MKLPFELLDLIESGEGINVEFKKSTTGITKDVYDTVCSFSNRNGGHIFFGVKDSGEILGVDPDCAGRMMKDFTITVNNSNKIYPPLYLSLENFEIDGKTILYVYVPSGKTVYRHVGRIYDRNNECDIDITDNADMVYHLYARKQDTYYVNKVFPAIPISSLRQDLMERARQMTRINTEHHPWMNMNDEEMLRSCGLILEDSNSHKTGITLAAILLFGTDSAIMSVLPQHKTDAIFRVFNTDRYDDRDVIITNLIESYDRLIAFGQKHLNDLFTMDGIQRISARDKILREIVSNLLMHRDFSSGYVPKLLIERDKVTTENANLAHGYGRLRLDSFKPFAKNPPIARVFREIGLADELGSGMRNSYKYTRIYSGGDPVFTEGDVFTITIPLSEAATATVGGNGQVVNEVNDEFRNQVSSKVSDQTSDKDSAQVNEPRLDLVPIDKEKLIQLLDYCTTPRSALEIRDFSGMYSRSYFRKKVLIPCLEAGLLEMTIPDKPKSSQQKYVRTNQLSK